MAPGEGDGSRFDTGRQDVTERRAKVTLQKAGGQVASNANQQGCERCGKPIPPRRHGGGNVKRFCSRDCKCRAAYERRKPSRQVASNANQRKRRPLPDVANGAAWTLRRDIERIERIFADDRFTANKEQMAPLLRGHLKYAAEVCQDLLSRIDHSTGG